MSQIDPVFAEHAQLIGQQLVDELRSGEPIIYPEYLNLDQTSRFLGVPKRTLENWRRRADGPPFTRFGQTIRYRVADLNGWMREHREGV